MDIYHRGVLYFEETAGMLDEKTRSQLKTRLNRIEGQVAGIRRMVEDEKYCVDILLQISAVRAALGQVGKIVLGRHMETCVTQAMTGADPLRRKETIDELLEVFSRYGDISGKK